jgi:hypothetical protein
VVGGTAVFRPSGSMLRIDADQIELAAPEQRQLWAKIPRPILAAFEPRALREVQGPRTGLNKIIGEWPGDETDEQIRSALETLS